MKVTDATLRAMAADPAEFRKRLLIDTDDGPAPLGERLDPWQHENLRAMDPAWLHAAGRDVPCTYTRAWWEMCRGSGKSSLQAAQSGWLLAFAIRPVQIVVAAVDADQAGIIKGYLRRIIELSPWLGAVLESQSNKVVNRRTGSELIVLASHLASSWGLTASAVCCDEVSMWPDRGLFDSLLSSVGKRRDSVVTCILNAGHMGDWAWDVRQKVMADPRWHFDAQTQPASWISREHLAEQQRILPPRVYARLWGGVWTQGTGDALAAELIDEAVTLDGPEFIGNPDHSYLMSIDIGVKRDRTAICVLGVNGATGKIHLAHAQSFAPTPGRSVDLSNVEDTIVSLSARFGHCAAYFDPWECLAIAQRCQRRGVAMNEFRMGAANAHAAASSLLQVFNERRCSLFLCPELIQGLKRLNVVESRLGTYRLDAPRGDSALGHCDLAIAFSIGIVPALHRCKTHAGPFVLDSGFLGSHPRETFTTIF